MLEMAIISIQIITLVGWGTSGNQKRCFMMCLTTLGLTFIGFNVNMIREIHEI